MRGGFVLFALSLGFSVAGAAQSPPPHPPRMVPEFLNPTRRSHVVEATCAESSARIAWAFDGQDAELTEFTFDGRPLDPEDFQTVGGWAGEFEQDFLVWIECGGGAAKVSFIQAELAGNSAARQITFNLIDRRPRLVRRRP